MGGSNPIKRVTEGITDVINAPISAVASGAKAIGLGGVGDFLNNATGTERNIVGGVTDMASGEAAKQKQKAKDAQNAAQAEYDTSRRQAASAAADASTAAAESARRAGDGTTNTLLTGGKGLEDDDATTSRRTLKGY